MTPEDVLRDPRLTDAEKADILCQMAYDAAEAAVALEEGMPGEESDLQRRISWPSLSFIEVSTWSTPARPSSTAAVRAEAAAV